MAEKFHRVGEYGNGETLYQFHCPGCKEDHAITVPRWKWNGSLDKPTTFPSILVDKGDPAYRCHTYITDGQIQFLPDCLHGLAGKTVELPDWEEKI